MKMSPLGRSCGSNFGNNGDTNNESEGTAKDWDHGGSQSGRAEFGGGGGGAWVALPADQAGVVADGSDGDQGLVHRLRGLPCLRRKPPTLAAEYQHPF